MNRRSIYNFLVWVLLPPVFWLSSCSDNDPQPSFEDNLVSEELLAERTTTQIASVIQLTGLDADNDTWKYDVTIHRITYMTSVNNQEVEASALLIVPQTEMELGLISFHRGTITADNEAPSETSLVNPVVSLYAGLASLGLVAVFPDMIGFGSSADLVHPYYVEDINANTVRDAIKAATAFLEDSDQLLNGDLYLAGYSQGGYITMATQKSIEQVPMSGFNLRATFPAAGAYDVKGLQEYFFGLDTYEQPYYLAYVSLSYQAYQSLELQLSDLFQDPFADRIPDLFDGTLTGSQINEELTEDIDELLTAEFLEGLDSDEKFSEIRSLLEENGLLDWTPEVLTYLYHSNADTYIPVENSIDTYDRLLSNGASSDLISLTIIDGADHTGGVIPYAEDVVDKLLELTGE